MNLLHLTYVLLLCLKWIYILILSSQNILNTNLIVECILVLILKLKILILLMHLLLHIYVWVSSI